jgi:hypothetical protein
MILGIFFGLKLVYPARTVKKRTQHGRIFRFYRFYWTTPYTFCWFQSLTGAWISGKLWAKLLLQTKRFFKRKKFRKLRRRGYFFWLLYFPQQPMTRKTQFARMGKGKGKIKFWSCYIFHGCIFLKAVASIYNIYKRFALLWKNKSRVRFIFGGGWRI